MCLAGRVLDILYFVVLILAISAAIFSLWWVNTQENKLQQESIKCECDGMCQDFGFDGYEYNGTCCCLREMDVEVLKYCRNI